MNYDEMYTDCVDNWKLVETKKVEIKGFACETEHFFQRRKLQGGKEQ